MRSFIEKNKFDLSKWLLIICGSSIWSITMVKSGLLTSYGIGFWGANGHDGIWHIALINSLSRFSLDMPILAGFKIQNYHLGFDLLLAFVHRTTRLDSSILYFQIIPPILAFLIGYLTYTVVYKWKQDRLSATLSTFFVYFGTSLGWVFNGGDSLFWAQQSLSTLINPPFALSLVVLLLGIIFVLRKKYIYASICFGLLIEIKVYAGLLAYLGLLMASVKTKELRKVLLFSSFIAFPIFLITNSDSANLIQFEPGWFLETLFAPDRLNWPKFFSALNTYRTGVILYKAVPAYIVAFVIFLIGNAGIRILGLWQIKNKDWFTKFGITIVVFGSLIPMVFVQKGTPWNTIQFFYYSLFFLNIFTGIVISQIFKKVTNKIYLFTFLSLILTITIVEITQTLKNYLPSRPPAKITYSELSALRELKKLPSGTVLTELFDKSKAEEQKKFPPRSLSVYESTAYVSAYSAQETYLEDEVNLSITGYNIEERKIRIKNFFENPNSQFLRDENIKYIYLISIPKFNYELIPGVSYIYKNSEYSILKFDSQIAERVKISKQMAINMVGQLPQVKSATSIEADMFDSSNISWKIKVSFANSLILFYKIDGQTGVVSDWSSNRPITPLAPQN